MSTRCRIRAALTAVVVAIVFAGGIAQAGMIGVNYAVSDRDVTGTAGAVPQANWNNESIAHSSSSKSGGLTSLIDDSGATVAGMSTSWTANAAYGNGAYAGGTDTTLLYGGPEAQNGSYEGGTAITISGIPYAEYDLYVYVKGWSANRTGEAQLEGVASSQIGFSTYMDFPGTHSRATSTDTQGTYVLWESLTADTVIVDVRKVNNNIIIPGFQVVEVPEPGTLALLAVGMVGLAKCRRRA